MSQVSTFEGLISKHPSYGKLLDVKGNYQVWAVHSELHWFLMIKGDGPDLPFITIEIRTEDFADIVPTVRDVQVDSHDPSLPHPENAGTYGPDNTLRDLYKMADKVAKEMGDYNLTNNNCQHFCNNLLKRMGFQYTFTTMVGTDTTLYEEKPNPVATAVGQVLKAVVPPEVRKMAATGLNASGQIKGVPKVYMP
jgi:hypothetical protein